MQKMQWGSRQKRRERSRVQTQQQQHIQQILTTVTYSKRTVTEVNQKVIISLNIDHDNIILASFTTMYQANQFNLFN